MNKNAIVPAEDKTIQLTTDTVSASRLVKKTIFSLDTNEYERLKFLAKAYAISSFNPKENGKAQNSEADYLLIMLKGMELGFEPMAAVSMISIIKGKPSLDGKGMLAIIHASGLLEDIQIEGDAESCTVSMTRKGYRTPFSSKFSIEDAKKMELLPAQGKTNNYSKQAKTMLKWRAVSACAREAFPDLLGGLYTQEELAPEHTRVLDDGSMEYAAPQLPAQVSPNPQNVDEWLENSKDNGDKWLADVKEYCTSFYTHVNHRDNSIALALQEGYIQRTMTPLLAGALMMKHCATKPISDGGLELNEAEIAEAFGGTLSEFLKIEGNTWGSAWDTLKRYDLWKTQQAAAAEQGLEPDEMPL